MSLYTVEIHRTHNSKNKVYSYGLQGMTYVNVRSSFVTHAPSAVGCDNAGRCACVGAGSIKEICVPSSQFYFEPKTALETKILKNNNRAVKK